MRIAQITLDGNLPRYGIGLAVVRLSEALARRGHDVTLLCRDDCARDYVATSGGDAGVRVVGLRRKRGLFGGSTYVRQVRRAIGSGVDVVHVHGLARIAWWLRSRGARRGAPLVVTALASDELGPAASAAGDAPPRRARRHARHIRGVLLRADVVIAPSRWMASTVEQTAGRPVDVVWLGRAEETPIALEPHGGFVVTVLARLVPVKGVTILLEAFALAFAADPAARLVVAGEGPLLESLRAHAQALGLAARVDFPGYVEGADRRRVLARSDVVVMPTIGDYETFGIAALDGSGAGLPIVVSDGGALPERVERGEGITVRSGDVGELARALARLRGDTNERRTMGACGQVTAASASWDRLAQAHETLYARAASKQPGSRVGR